jgi:hypothetical protein
MTALEGLCDATQIAMVMGSLDRASNTQRRELNLDQHGLLGDEAVTALATVLAKDAVILKLTVWIDGNNLRHVKAFSDALASNTCLRWLVVRLHPRYGREAVFTLSAVSRPTADCAGFSLVIAATIGWPGPPSTTGGLAGGTQLGLP